MKYFLLLWMTFYSLPAMETSPGNPSIDEQIIQLHEKVNAIRAKQANEIETVAARINSDFYLNAAEYQDPNTLSAELQERLTATSFPDYFDAILQAKITENTKQIEESVRRLSECQTVLEDFETKKKKAKKPLTEHDKLKEKANFITAEQATHDVLKKASELNHYLVVLYDRRSKQPYVENKLGFKQADEI